MSTPEVRVQAGEDTPMSEVPPTQENADSTQQDASQDVIVTEPAQTEIQEPAAHAKKAVRPAFLEFLTSPIVQLVVGQGEGQTILTAHKTLLTESPYLVQELERVKDETNLRIELPEESVDAFGSFLQYQYTGDYTYQQKDTASGEEDGASDIDQSGDQLLRHARVYTLAEKLGMPSLKTLAHSKIHRINSTARGEIAYARYVYRNTPVDDVIIRKPVAAFWSSRSHVLRHEAEEDFRSLCLDVPEFSYDVLNLVLDAKEKKAQHQADGESGIRGSARKRLRTGI